MKQMSNVNPNLLLSIAMITVFLLSSLIISYIFPVESWSLVAMSLVILVLIYVTFSFVILPLIGRFYCIKFFKNSNEYPIEIDTSKEYALVLISNAQSRSMINNYLTRSYKNWLVYSSVASLYFLIRYFKNCDKTYKLKQKINKKDLDEAVSDTKCNELYLIGHGSRGCFKTSEVPVYYSEYDDGTKSKKQIISQLHCNSLGYKGKDTEESKKRNTALTTILAINKEDSFLTDRNNTVIDVLFYCWNLSHKRKKFT